MGQAGKFVDNTLGTNIFGPNSTDRAIDAQTNATNAANATALSIFNQQRADNEPFRQAGIKALGGLEENKFMDNFQQDPGFQFRLAEGNKAINAAAAARGLGTSGATLKALTRFGQDFASNEYNNIYNRQFNRLSALAGLGSSANQAGMNAAGNYGNTVSNNFMGLGNATAAAEIAEANRGAQLLGGLAQGAGAYYGGKQKPTNNGNAHFSDERLKTNIERVSKDELNELRSHLKPYKFNYISEVHGEGDWIGVMAQDLEKSKLGKTIVYEDENGFKKINLDKVLMLFLATIAEG